ncbi:MAG: hypothetical protein ACM3MK_11720 [Chitinophagales bacterium]
MNCANSIIGTQKQGRVPVIAEIKRRIPKLAGQIETDRRNAGMLAKIYEAGGAAAISVVGEPNYFGGNPEEDIPQILKAVSLPVLIKDFILCTELVDYYALLVSSISQYALNRVTLLVITHMAGEKTPQLIQHIHSYGMTALCETRNLDDLCHLRGLKDCPALIGINNKIIDQLETDDEEVGLNSSLIAKYRETVGDALIISESGHQCPADVEQSMAAGADAVLIGTALMLADDPATRLKEFIKAGRMAYNG